MRERINKRIISRVAGLKVGDRVTWTFDRNAVGIITGYSHEAAR